MDEHGLFQIVVKFAKNGRQHFHIGPMIVAEIQFSDAKNSFDAASCLHLFGRKKFDEPTNLQVRMLVVHQG